MLLPDKKFILTYNHQVKMVRALRFSTETEKNKAWRFENSVDHPNYLVFYGIRMNLYGREIVNQYRMQHEWAMNGLKGTE